MTLFTLRCLDCGKEFASSRPNGDQCQYCFEREAAEYAENRGLDLDMPPPKYSKAYNRERLGVIGDRDE